MKGRMVKFKWSKKKLAVFATGVIVAGCLIGCGASTDTSSSSEATTDTTSGTTTVATDSSAVTLTATSDILGLGDTGNKTSLKQDLIYTEGPGDINLYYYDENGDRVIYDDEENVDVAVEPVSYTGSAVFDISDGADIDDSLIDTSNATVSLIDGNGYYADEFVLNADTLDGTWENGEYVYTLSEGDLEWNTWGYDTSTDYNSGREWSIMGGDGNGVYNFTFQVSGITYDGEEVPATTFPVSVYIYGRSCTDLVEGVEYVPNEVDEDYTSGITPTDEVQWNWTTDNADSVAADEPYLNDNYSDYFSIIWPEGTDASDITADDVTVTLKSKYGDELTLQPENDYGEQEYAVIANDDETEVVVTYQQWAFVPVYSTMEITVNDGDLTATNTYDIASVAAYLVQTGGGGVAVDHTDTCYNYYGVLGMTLDNAANTEYTLSTDIDGTTYYYAEDEDGNAYLSPEVVEDGEWGETASAPDDAWTGDATEKYNIDVEGNVVFVETRTENTQDLEVDGQTYTFTENVNASVDISDMIANGATLDDGYNLSGTGVAKWAWTQRYQSGWTTSTAQPTSLPYVEGEEYGYGYEPGSSNPAYDEDTSETETATEAATETATEAVTETGTETESETKTQN